MNGKVVEIAPFYAVLVMKKLIWMRMEEEKEEEGRRRKNRKVEMGEVCYCLLVLSCKEEKWKKK